MKFKTLVKNRGTKYQEFFGYRDEWYTSQLPINFMDMSVTFEDYKKFTVDCVAYEDILEDHWDNVEMVTIEMKIIEE